MSKILITTKAPEQCISRLCDELSSHKDNIMFRITIGSADNSTLKDLEPGAPSFEERLRSLKHAHKRGFQTSVSCEPMLDDKIDDVIRAVRPYVTDSIWLGRANNLVQIVSLNCPDDKDAVAAARNLVAIWNDDAIRALHAKYKDDPLIRWKDSVKKVVGLARPQQKGLDI